MIARAVRNNNPGNLQAGDHWQGLMPRVDMAPEQAAETRFAVFVSPVWGFRALGILLLNYERIYRLKTVKGWISRFAPATENDTAAYISALCAGMSVGGNIIRPNDEIDLRGSLALPRACKSIAIHESGGWLFTDADLNHGTALAEAA